MKYPQEICKRPYCEVPSVLNELCSVHLDEAKAAKELRDRAISLLHGKSSFDNPPLDQSLEADFEKAVKWWDRVCSAVNAEREDPVLKGETRASVEWFIQLAMSIDRDNNEIAAGISPSSEHERSHYWARLEKLVREAGKA